MVAPASASITSSTSTNLQPSFAATNGPTVVLPEPMKPVRTMRRGAADCAEAFIELVYRLTCLHGERSGTYPHPYFGRKILVFLRLQTWVRCKIVKTKEL